MHTNFTLRTALLVSLLLFLGCTPASEPEADMGAVETVPEPAVNEVQTAETQAALTPQQVLNNLREGNRRFTAGETLNRDWMAQVRATSDGQFPYAAVLNCIDSRTSAVTVFDQGIGDIFEARVAGNVENTDILGSFEFATAVAGSKVVLVLGHTACGAVKGAADEVELGNLTDLLENLDPAVEEARDDVDGAYNSQNSSFVNAIVEENVRITVEDILERSPTMKERVDAGELIVAGAIYDVGTGEVRFLDN